MRRWTLGTVLLMVFPAFAHAQADNPWLIVPVTSGQGDTAWVDTTTDEVASALAATRVATWSTSRAKQQFERAGSAPAREVSDSDVVQWVDQSTQAIRNLAEGDYLAAQEQLKQAQALSRDAVEELNRQNERATRVLDTCLYVVRVLLDTGTESQAIAMAQECRQLAPRVRPTRYMHPPEVRKLLAEVDASRRSKARRLEVESEPEDCTVRVNGVVLGRTPIDVRDLFPGRYRVQVECSPNRRGRVHVADLTTSSARVFVDVRFDRTISSEPVLALEYPTTEDEARYRIEDANAIVEAVPSPAIVLVSKPSESAYALRLLRGSPLRQSALTHVAAGPDGALDPTTLGPAIETLQAGGCVDYTVTPPAPLPCRVRSMRSADDGRPARRMPERTFKAGMALAVTGSASLLTGYLLVIARTGAANLWLSTLPSASNQNRWIRIDNALLWTAGAGATLLTTSMPMILPKRSKVPWPAWLSGVLGLGAAGFSLGYGLTGEKPAQSCRGTTEITDLAAAEACVVRAERVDAAFLAGVTAAPLLAVPLTYLLRRSDKRLEANIAVDRSLAYLSLQGRW